MIASPPYFILFSRMVCVWNGQHQDDVLCRFVCQAGGPGQCNIWQRNGLRVPQRVRAESNVALVPMVVGRIFPTPIQCP